MNDVPCEIDWRPMSHFKGRACENESAAWKKPFDHTMASLREELTNNGIESALIETYHSRIEYTMGGRPRAGIAPGQPSVQIFFEVNGLPVCIPSAKYADWGQNLKAIQMTLRARRLEREKYGCSTIEQQYQGHAQLPEGRSTIHAPTGPENAAALLLRVSTLPDIKIADILENQDTFRAAFKAAAKRAHPDSGKVDSSEEIMDAVGKAKKIIEEFKGW